MTADQARAWFLQLPARRKPYAVALLSHNLTIAARGWVPGEGGADAAASRYWTFNELQHTLSAKLMHLSGERPDSFPDDGFLDVLFDRAEMGGCQRDLTQAFAWSAAVKT